MSFLELMTRTYKLTPRSTHSLLRDATSDQLLCITEVILNTLNGNLTISKDPQLELTKFKIMLRKVAKIVADSTSTSTYNSIAPGRAATKLRNSRTTAASRKLLREVYVERCKTLVEFLERCIPQLKILLNQEEEEEEESEL